MSHTRTHTHNPFICLFVSASMVWQQQLYQYHQSKISILREKGGKKAQIIKWKDKPDQKRRQAKHLISNQVSNI